MKIKPITIYTANFRQKANNNKYPNECRITSFAEFREATKLDNVCCLFQNSQRSKDNFISADCFSMDIDNTHTDNKQYHKTIDDVKKAFPDVAFYFVYSRNHNKTKIKNGIEQAPRYKAHIYFPLSQNVPTEQADKLNNIKMATGGLFPYFDAAAADLAHFYYGVEHEQEECGAYIPGEICIDEYIRQLASKNELTPLITDTLNTAKDTAKIIIGEEWTEKWSDLKQWIDKTAYITGMAAPAAASNYTNTGITNSEFKGELSIQQLDKCHYFEGFAKSHNIQYRRQVQGIFVYYFVNCPWSDKHTTDSNDTETKITIMPLSNGNAAIRFNCWHSHCIDKKWEDYKAYYENLAIEQGLQEHQPAIDDSDAENKEASAGLDDLDIFTAAISKDTYKPIATGFSWFDDLLGGGFMRDTAAFIMAAPATGKTTLCQQLGEKMAAGGHKVIYFNFESSRNMMLAKAISAKLTEKNIFLSATDILRGYAWNHSQKDAIIKEIEEYRQGPYKNIKYCPDSIGANIETLYNYLTNIGDAAVKDNTEAPIVFIDYIHLLKAEKEHEPREILKKASSIITEYAKKYHTFAVIISATNRESNRAGNLSMTSGRDSSNIEYDADYAITMNYYEVDRGAVSPQDNEEMARLTTEKMRRLILRTVKNRWGLDGISENVYFNAASNTFYGENDFIPEALTDNIKPFDAIKKIGPAAKKAERVYNVIYNSAYMMISDTNGTAPLKAVIEYFKADKGFTEKTIRKWAECGQYGFICTTSDELKIIELPEDKEDTKTARI